MPGQFLSPDGDLESAFVSDPAIIDQFAKTGSLWSWGYNYNGQLGDGTNSGVSVPIQISGTIWKQISRGYDGQAGIKTDGTLWTWGRGDLGSLGDNTLVDKSSPVQTVAGGTNWKQVSVGVQFSHAIKTDGTLWTWGRNDYGSLGDGTETRRSSPVQIAGTTWKQVSNGNRFAAAIKTDGTLWGWGRNDYGQLGDGTTTNRSSPVQIAGTTWKIVSCGNYHAAAIKTDGTLWGWGENVHGQLGDNTTTYRSSPVQTASGGTNWKQVTITDISTAAIKTDGTLWTWGGNVNYGILGDGTTVGKSTPVQIAGTTWSKVSVGTGYAMAAIKTDGTLWTWGGNYGGNLGDGTTSNKSSPVQTVASGTNWKQVTVGQSGMSAIYFYDAGNLYP